MRGASSNRPTGRRIRRAPSSPLDPRPREAVERFVRVLARCGVTSEEIHREMARACRRVPKSWAPKAVAAQREVDDAAHVLTLWFSDPAYLDPTGNPLPLPLRGATASLETLTRQVDRKLEATEVLRYLLRHGSLRRIGKRYVPRDRMLFLSGGTADFQRLRSLLGMLRSLEHNRQPKKRRSGWFEAFAENPRFPVSARAGFDQRLRVRANKLLQHLDVDMHRQEKARKSGEPTIRIGVGIYRFEDAASPRLDAAARRKRSR